MDEDDDDLYGGSGVPSAQQLQNTNNHTNQTHVNVEQQEGDIEDEDDEGEAIEEDTDSDIDIITERKTTSKPEPVQPAPRISEAVKIEPSRATPIEKQSRPQTAPVKVGSPTKSTQQKPGYEYPEVHTSNIDFDADPTYKPAGKTITEVDFDADLAEHDKPWRRPGSDQSDFFNYGFDEFTWATYCLKQQTMRNAINEQKAESAKFEMMFGGGMPGMPAQQQQQVPQGAQGMAQQGGMPDMNPDMMNAMAQQMMASGMDPSQMDFGTFMQQFQSMQGGGGGVPSGPQGYGGGQAYGNGMMDGGAGGGGGSAQGGAGGRNQGGNYGGRGRGRRW